MLERRDLLKLGAGVAAGFGVASGLGASRQDADQADTFVAAITGGQQPDTVDTPAGGAAVFSLGADGSELAYALFVTDATDVNQAHIHQGAAGEEGPFVVWLYPGTDAREPELMEGEFSGLLAEGTITAEDFVGPLEGMEFDALVESMRAGETYVNVHTEANPGGEIRGQLLDVDAVAGAVAGVPDGGTGNVTDDETVETPTENETTEMPVENETTMGNETTTGNETTGNGTTIDY